MGIGLLLPVQASGDEPLKINDIATDSFALSGVKWHPGHYSMLYMTTTDSDMPLIINGIADMPGILGIQRTYKWKSLEPIEGRYDFSSIKKDLAALAAIGKRLVVQVQVKSNKSGQAFVPSYLLTGEYDGGIYNCTNGGNNAAYWNAGVQERMVALVEELGRQLDDYPNLEAVNFDETAPSTRDEVWLKAHLDDYLAGMMRVVLAAKQAFPHTVVLQYINWPVKPLPGMIAKFKSAGVGVGGPDVYVEDQGLAQGAYRYIRSVGGTLPIGMAVQYGNYSRKSDNSTSAPPSIASLHHFARDELKANYIFWLRRTRDAGSRADYYQDLKNYLHTIDWQADPSGGLNTACPAVFVQCVN
jgi:hypothetical protein